MDVDSSYDSDSFDAVAFLTDDISMNDIDDSSDEDFVPDIKSVRDYLAYATDRKLKLVKDEISQRFDTERRRGLIDYSDYVEYKYDGDSDVDPVSLLTEAEKDRIVEDMKKVEYHRHVEQQISNLLSIDQNVYEEDDYGDNVEFEDMTSKLYPFDDDDDVSEFVDSDVAKYEEAYKNEHSKQIWYDGDQVITLLTFQKNDELYMNFPFIFQSFKKYLDGINPKRKRDESNDDEPLKADIRDRDYCGYATCDYARVYFLNGVPAKTDDRPFIISKNPYGGLLVDGMDNTATTNLAVIESSLKNALDMSVKAGMEEHRKSLSAALEACAKMATEMGASQLQGQSYETLPTPNRQTQLNIGNIILNAFYFDAQPRRIPDYGAIYILLKLGIDVQPFVDALNKAHITVHIQSGPIKIDVSPVVTFYKSIECTAEVHGKSVLEIERVLMNTHPEIFTMFIPLSPSSVDQINNDIEYAKYHRLSLEDDGGYENAYQPYLFKLHDKEIDPVFRIYK
jgi:hypothetical protein